MKPENNPIHTYVTDNFPVNELECQFYEICKHYNPDRCEYGKNCQAYLLLDNNLKVKVRDLLRHSIESYVTQETLSNEIKSIVYDVN